VESTTASTDRLAGVASVSARMVATGQRASPTATASPPPADAPTSTTHFAPVRRAQSTTEAVSCQEVTSPVGQVDSP
jgi:hypothetical protein